jgi:hypothetical protein
LASAALIFTYWAAVSAVAPGCAAVVPPEQAETVTAIRSSETPSSKLLENLEFFIDHHLKKIPATQAQTQRSRAVKPSAGRLAPYWVTTS